MKFIKLTIQRSDDGVWVNFDHVISMERLPGGTRVCGLGDPRLIENRWDVQETPEDITALLEEKQNG